MSQFFANIYLDALDHFVKERLRAGRYLRYVDDFCCFHDDKGFLREVRAEVAGFLAGLRQTLNQGKSRIRRVKEGIESRPTRRRAGFREHGALPEARPEHGPW